MVRKYHYKELGMNVKETNLEIPDELKPFLQTKDRDEDYYGSIDVKKYFLTFIEECYEIIKSGSLKLPYGLTLSTEFTPCEVCKNTDNIVTQYLRCRHLPGCQEHQKTTEDPSYKEKCQCRNYTSPCLSYSKIGLVLHLEFNNKDGSVLNLDVDINPPQFPVSKRRYNEYRYISSVKIVEDPDFDGSNKHKRAWLEKHRPVGWRAEWDKSEDMSDATGDNDGLLRGIRLRFFNFQDVIPEEVNINTKALKILIFAILECSVLEKR